MMVTIMMKINENLQSGCCCPLSDDDDQRMMMVMVMVMMTVMTNSHCSAMPGQSR